MNITEYKKMIEKDNSFLEDEVNIDSASLSIPTLVSKYQQAIYEESMILKFMITEKDKVKRDRWNYYLGKADPEVYKKEPFDHKILRSDVDIFLNADELYSVATAKVKEQELKINLIESFSKTLMNFSYSVTNAIKWKKFLSGDIG